MDPGGCAALVENPQEALNSEGRLRKERPVCVFGPSPSERAQTPALLTVCLTKVKQPLRVFRGIDPLQQTRKNKCFLQKQEDCHRQKLSYFSELARNE